jgi:hypothetical protein
VDAPSVREPSASLGSDRSVAAPEATVRARDAAPAISSRSVGLLVAVAIVLALGMSWPLPLHLGSELPAAEPPTGLLDPMYQAWEIAWEGHALAHDPGALYDANIFWPAHLTLANTDAAPGYAPFAVIGTGPRDAVIRYDVLFLLSSALAVVGAGLLAMELGAGLGGGLLAGAAFAFAPWRLAQRGHLNVLSSGGIALALFLLVRGWRRERPGLVLLGWVVAAWQLSLGFAIGLPFAMLLAVIAVATTVATVVRRPRRLPSRSVLAASIAGVVLFAAAGVALAIPYYRVAATTSEVRSELERRETRWYSPPPIAFLAASRESLLWGKATESARRRLHSVEEEALFPGLTVVVLAGVGLAASSAPRRVRVVLGLFVVVTAVLSMGFRFLGGALGFGLIWSHAPGWRALRTPGRMQTFTSLGLALLAGLGTQAITSRISGARVLSVGARTAVNGILVAAVLLEGAGVPAYAQPPPTPQALLRVPAPMLGLPSSRLDEVSFQFWSIGPFPELVNGYSRFTPCFIVALRRNVESFPNRTSVSLLEEVGVASVVLDVRLAAGTPWASAASQPIDGLGITEARHGALIVYELPRRTGPARPISGRGGVFPSCPPIG